MKRSPLLVRLLACSLVFCLLSDPSANALAAPNLWRAMATSPVLNGLRSAGIFDQQALAPGDVIAPEHLAAPLRPLRHTLTTILLTTMLASSAPGQTLLRPERPLPRPSLQAPAGEEFSIVQPTIDKADEKKAEVAISNGQWDRVVAYGPIALGPLIHFLDDHPSHPLEALEKAQSALITIAREGGLDTLSRLHDAFLTNGRIKLGMALYEAGGEQFLVNDLQSKHAEETRSAIPVLGITRDVKAVPALINLLGREDVGDSAVDALFLIGQPSIDPLIQLLQTPSLQVPDAQGDVPPPGEIESPAHRAAASAYSRDVTARANAIKALVLIGQPAVGPLRSALNRSVLWPFGKSTQDLEFALARIDPQASDHWRSALWWSAVGYAGLIGGVLLALAGIAAKFHLRGRLRIFLEPLVSATYRKPYDVRNKVLATRILYGLDFVFLSIFLYYRESVLELFNIAEPFSRIAFMIYVVSLGLFMQIHGTLYGTLDSILGMRWYALPAALARSFRKARTARFVDQELASRSLLTVLNQNDTPLSDLSAWEVLLQTIERYHDAHGFPTLGAEFHQPVGAKTDRDGLARQRELALAAAKVGVRHGIAAIAPQGDLVDLRVLPGSWPIFVRLVQTLKDNGMLVDQNRDSLYQLSYHTSLRGAFDQEAPLILLASFFRNWPTWTFFAEMNWSVNPRSSRNTIIPGQAYTYRGATVDTYTGSVGGMQTNILDGAMRRIESIDQAGRQWGSVIVEPYRNDLMRKAILGAMAAKNPLRWAEFRRHVMGWLQVYTDLPENQIRRFGELGIQASGKGGIGTTNPELGDWFTDLQHALIRAGAREILNDDHLDFSWFQATGQWAMLARGLDEYRLIRAQQEVTGRGNQSLGTLNSAARERVMLRYAQMPLSTAQVVLGQIVDDFVSRSMKELYPSPVMRSLVQTLADTSISEPDVLLREKENLLLNTMDPDLSAADQQEALTILDAMRQASRRVEEQSDEPTDFGLLFIPPGLLRWAEKAVHRIWTSTDSFRTSSRALSSRLIRLSA